MGLLDNNHKSISITATDFESFMGKNNELYIKPKGSYATDFPFDSIKPKSLNDLRDEYHSIGELYEFRKAYNALLFNEWAKIRQDGQPLSSEYSPIGLKPRRLYDVHKSWRHNDGELAFGGGWFIVVAMLPDGQITNHYKAEDWDLFQIPEVEKAKYEFDGHTPADTLQRMNNLLKRK